jgi:hypothetical protein
MLPSWNPSSASPHGGRESKRTTPSHQYGAHEKPHATRNRQPASGPKGRGTDAASIAAREPPRDVTLGNTRRYRTSATVSGRSCRTIRNSPAAGKKKRLPRLGSDSPRQVLTNKNGRAGADALAPGNGKLVPAGGICPFRWTDNDGWLGVDASGVRRLGMLNCNTGSAGAAAGSAARTPSKDRGDGQDAKRHLAPIALLGNAEMGPREITLP